MRAALETQGSTRGFALFRILLVTELFYETSQGSQLHPAYFDAPQLGQVLLTVMLFATWAAWIGYKTRLATLVLALVYGYVYVRWGVVEHPKWAPKGAHMSQALFVLAMLPSGRSLSLDRWLAVRKARAKGERPPAEQGPVWGARLMTISLSCMYAWVGLDMVKPLWLSGEQLEHLWLVHRGTADAFAQHPELLHTCAVAGAWIAAFITWVLAVGLLFPRWRPKIIVVGVLFHATIWFVVGGWPYTYSVIVSYVVLVDPERWHRAIEAVFAPGNSPSLEDPLAD